MYIFKKQQYLKHISSKIQYQETNYQKSIQICRLASLGDLNQLQAKLLQGWSIDTYDQNGRTPLHLASANGHYKTVQWLIENGAQLRLDNYGITAIDEAKKNNQIQIIEMLKGKEIYQQKEVLDDPKQNTINVKQF